MSSYHFCLINVKENVNQHHVKTRIHQPIISWLWMQKFYKNQQKHSDNYMEVTVETIAYFIIICKLCATRSLSVKFIINVYMCTHVFPQKYIYQYMSPFVPLKSIKCIFIIIIFSDNTNNS